MVSLLTPGPVASVIRPRLRARSWTASAIAELVISAIACTPSTSNHFRVIERALSVLFWWSAERISILRPRTVPPKSAAAILAASTDPTPPNSLYRPDWSFSTPIRIGPSAARASGAVSTIAAAIAAENAFRILSSLEAGLAPAFVFRHAHDEHGGREEHGGLRLPIGTALVHFRSAGSKLQCTKKHMQCTQKW